jgi:RNA polymerase sigma-70 factor (ECF subfamily)
MMRESISFLRKKKRLEFSADDIEIYEEAYNEVNSELDVDEVQQLIDKLPDGYRMVFNMYAIEGYKHSEIAEMLSIAESTSKSQLFKARKLLQQQIKQLNKASNGTN